MEHDTTSLRVCRIVDRTRGHDSRTVQRDPLSVGNNTRFTGSIFLPYPSPDTGSLCRSEPANEVETVGGFEDHPA